MHIISITLEYLKLFNHCEWLNSSIWLTGTITLGQSGLGSNVKKRRFYILISSRTGASPLDAVSCQI